MTAFDKYTDTTDWIDALVDLGVDPTTFDKEAAIGAKLSQLGKHAEDFRTAGAGVNTAASIIAADPSDYNTVISAAINAATAEDEDRRTVVFDVFERAYDRLYAEYASAFRRRGASLLTALTPAYTDHSENARDAWENLPAGVRTLEQAERVNAIDEWQQLKDAHISISNIRALISAWMSAGVLNAPKNVDAYAVMYGDYDHALDLYARYGGQRFTGAAAADAEPTLTDPATLESPAPQEVNEGRAEMIRYQQRLDDEQAFAEALSGTRNRVSLNREGTPIPR